MNLGKDLRFFSALGHLIERHFINGNFIDRTFLRNTIHRNTFHRNTLHRNTSSDNEIDFGVAESSTEMRRLRFGISKMVSDVRIYQPKKSNYKRSATVKFSTESGNKYLARKCSMVENSTLDKDFDYDS